MTRGPETGPSGAERLFCSVEVTTLFHSYPTGFGIQSNILRRRGSGHVVGLFDWESLCSLFSRCIDLMKRTAQQGVPCFEIRKQRAVIGIRPPGTGRRMERGKRAGGEKNRIVSLFLVFTRPECTKSQYIVPWNSDRREAPGNAQKESPDFINSLPILRIDARRDQVTAVAAITTHIPPKSPKPFPFMSQFDSTAAPYDALFLHHRSTCSFNQTTCASL